MSAIIPAYNSAKFLAAALDSVFSQTYEAIECIVVDDGSTDSTAEVASTYADVLLIRQPNKGVSAARNKGAEVASGEVLGFLDADDVWLPEKTELQVRALEETPDAALAYGPYHRVDSELRHIATVAAPRVEEAFRNTLLLRSPSISLITAGLVRSHAFDRVGGFDTALSTSADLDLVLRIGRDHAVATVPEPVALYRQSPLQMSGDVALMERDMKRVFSKFFEDGPLDGFMAWRKRAYANLFLILAASYARQGHLQRGLMKAAQAVAFSPTSVVSALRRFSTRSTGSTL